MIDVTQVSTSAVIATFNWVPADGVAQYDVPVPAAGDYQVGITHNGQNGPDIVSAFELAMVTLQPMIISVVTVTPGQIGTIIVDGRGRLSYDRSSGTYTAELLVPVLDDHLGHDRTKSSSTRFALILWDATSFAAGSGSLGLSHGAVGIGSDTRGWARLPPPTLLPPATRMPSDLPGLIAYISDHSGASEVYTFAPSTGANVQLTSDGTYKRGVSLSHDRQQVAFHGAPAETDYRRWEIWAIGTDGTGLRQLTDNDVLDGHPAWAPDDARIVFASFRDGDFSGLIAVDSASGAELATLSPAGVRDNDPEFLPDGRILFKTDRFSRFPEQRIAVMAADGSGATRLSASPGTSDHDPVGDATHVVFERFMKSTHYSSDPLFAFAPWHIIEAPLIGGGSGERTLVGDDWVNWLPVYSPDGRFVAYLKTVSAYTELKLMTRSGQDLGRLLPDVTTLLYFDWK